MYAKNITNISSSHSLFFFLLVKIYDCDERETNVEMNTKKLVENPEHVPLLVVTPQSPNPAAFKHSSNMADTANFPSNLLLTNGNGLIENSDQHQLIRPMQTVTLSSGTPSLIMRSRLNQYKSLKKSTIVSIDNDNGVRMTTISNNNNNLQHHSNSKGNGKKKKKSQDDF